MVVGFSLYSALIKGFNRTIVVLEGIELETNYFFTTT